MPCIANSRKMSRSAEQRQARAVGPDQFHFHASAKARSHGRDRSLAGILSGSIAKECAKMFA